jgi:hypothetical protein
MADAKRNELDHDLDVALAKYAAAEPRTGLEERILANMRAARAQVPHRAWWRWGLAAAVATVAVVVVAMAWRSGKPSPSVMVSHPSGATQVLKEPGTQVVANGQRSGAHPSGPGPARRATAIHAHPPVAIAAEARLDRFPSPQPLSEQELALARYVREFPQEATLIARTQAEFENEIQQKMKDARSETDDYGSDQQER